MISGKLANFKLTDFLVNVKWGKELYSDLEVNTEDEVLVFKS